METKPTPKQTLAKAPTDTSNQMMTHAPAQTLAAIHNDNLCKYCKNPITDSEYFCSNCGKKIKEPPFKFSWGKTLGLIIFSVLFPPLGIIPGIRYLRIKETSAKILGTFIIVLSIILTVLFIFVFMNFINNMSRLYNGFYDTQNFNNSPSSVNDQIKALENAGF